MYFDNKIKKFYKITKKIFIIEKKKINRKILK